jgi:hypothetical protein
LREWLSLLLGKLSSILGLNWRRNWFFLITLSLTITAQAAPKKNYVKYKTFFGNCPQRTIGKLTLWIVDKFESRNSLRYIKSEIEENDLMSKYFIKTYDIKYDPAEKLLSFSYSCPEPMMKVKVFKEGGKESYTAILVEDGKLFDPSYEYLLKAEKILKRDLPLLALSLKQIDSPLIEEISHLFGKKVRDLNPYLSEVILNERDELTVILSLKNRPSSAFLGKGNWYEKLYKLNRIVRFIKEKKSAPSRINLTNPKKVVVKFRTKS